MPGFAAPTLALLCGLLAPRPTPVTLQIRAAAAPVVVEQIAQATGRKLTFDKAFARDYLCVCVKDADPDTLLAKVAAACEGKWIAKGDVSQLVPDQAARQKRVSERHAQSVAGFAKAIKYQVDQLDPKPTKPKSNDPDDDYTPPPAGPGHRLLVAYIRALGPNFFADLGTEQRIVCATSPTRMQRSLPDYDPRPFLTQWVAQHNRQVKAMKESDESGTLEGPEDELTKALRELGVPTGTQWDEYKTIDAMPVKLMLILTTGTENDVSIQIAAYDRAGQMILNDEVMLSERGYPVEEDRAAVAIDEEGHVARRDRQNRFAKTTTFALSPDSKRWADIQAKLDSSDEETQQDLPKEDVDFLDDLVTHDPLSLVTTDFFFDLAERNKVNIVASLPDDAVWYEELPGGKPTVEWGLYQFFGIGNGNGNESERLMFLDKAEGYWIARPIDPETARADRIDRVAGTRFAQEMAKSPWLPLDEASTVIASMTENAMSNLSIWCGSNLDLSQYMSVFGNTSNDWLRLWGCLDPGSRAALRSGTPVPFQTMPAAAREQLAHMVFGPSQDVENLAVARRPSGLQILDTMVEGYSASFGEHTSDLGNEPTELLPNGLDARGRLSAKVTDEACLLFREGVSYVGGRALGMEEMALLKLMAEAAPNDNDAGMQKALGLPCQVSKRATIRMRCEVAPGHGMQTILIDPSSPTSAATTFDNLAPEVKAEIDRKKQLIKASPLMKLIELSRDRGMRHGSNVQPP